VILRRPAVGTYVPPDAAQQFRGVFSDLLGARLPEYASRFAVYCGTYPGDAQKYVQYHQDMLDLAGVDVYDKRVLDAGCGFAPALILYGILGARELNGIELQEEMVRTVRAYEPLLPPEIRQRLMLVEGSASSLPYADRSMDIVLSNEAISHYLDVPAFLGEVSRVLAPGGTLIIADSNNARCRARRHDVYDLWEQFETGFHAPSEGVAGRKHYALKRLEMIRDQLPDLADEAARELALRTHGMTREQLVGAVSAYRRSEAMPEQTYRRGQVAVDPEGWVLERLLDPFELASGLRALGLDARAYGYWGGAGRNRAIRITNRVLQRASRIAISTTENFRVVATKTRVRAA
jgi:SAM-dependent methyltransferase